MGELGRNFDRAQILKAPSGLKFTVDGSGVHWLVDASIDRMLAVLVGPRDRQVQVQFEAYLATGRRPDLLESVKRIVEAYEHAATTILASLGATEPEKAARHLIAVLDGFVLQRIANPRPDDQDAVRAAVHAIARTYRTRVAVQQSEQPARFERVRRRIVHPEGVRGLDV